MKMSYNHGIAGVHQMSELTWETTISSRKASIIACMPYAMFAKAGHVSCRAIATLPAVAKSCSATVTKLKSTCRVQGHTSAAEPVRAPGAVHASPVCLGSCYTFLLDLKNKVKPSLLHVTVLVGPFACRVVQLPVMEVGVLASSSSC